MSDSSPKVIITVHSIDLSFDNCEYPEPTREQIAEKLCEYVNSNVFSYSELRHSNTDTINKDIPQSHTDKIFTSRQTITSNLSTFGELEEAFKDAQKMSEDMAIGRASTEQGGNREENAYNTDRDPLNED